MMTPERLSEIRPMTKLSSDADDLALIDAVRDLLAEVDRLRAQVGMALSRGNHNNSCAFTSTGHCVCWKSDLDPSLRKW